MTMTKNIMYLGQRPPGCWDPRLQCTKPIGKSGTACTPPPVSQPHTNKYWIFTDIYCFNLNIMIIHTCIKDLTPVRGQDGKISVTLENEFWSPTRLSRVGDQYKSFPRVSEILALLPFLTNFPILYVFRCLILILIFVLFTFHRAFSRKFVFRWWS
jgi:hypothetical protein